MSTLCLVSRDWSNPARRILYRIIFDLERTRFQLLIKTLRDTYSLRKYVRALYTNPYDEIMEFARLLPKAQIYLLLSRISTPNESIAALPSLAGLHIKDLQWGREAWSQIFTECRGIEDLRLHISSHPSAFPPTWQERDAGSWLPALHTLKLTMMDRWTIPPTSSNTLHTLVLYSYTARVYIDLLLDLLHRHSDSLRRVLIDGIKFEEDSDPFALDHIGNHLTTVESLYIRRASPAITEQIFDSLPQSIVDVSLDMDYPVTGASCAEFLARCKRIDSPLRSIALRLRVEQDSMRDSVDDKLALLKLWAGNQGVLFNCAFDFPTGDKGAVADQSIRYPEWSRL
jgi:hypothetical protein